MTASQHAIAAHPKTMTPKSCLEGPRHFRTFNPLDPDASESQRTLDVNMALYLSSVREGSVPVSHVTSFRRSFIHLTS